MVYCQSCGRENEDTGKFCRYCGASLPPSTSSDVEAPRASVGFGGRATGEDLVIKCSLCGGEDFAQDKGRLDSKWGVTSFKVIMLTCRACGHIELFNKGRSIFDFD